MKQTGLRYAKPEVQIKRSTNKSSKFLANSTAKANSPLAPVDARAKMSLALEAQMVAISANFEGSRLPSQQGYAEKG